MTPSYVGSTEAAKAVGVTPVTMQRWVKQGRVHPAFVTPGGQYRWNLDDLRRQLGMPTERENVTDRTSKPEKPPVATAIVTSDLGVLVGRRNDGKPPWAFIGGKIHEGESSADAATREVKEETGLIVRPAQKEIGRRIHPATGVLIVYIACRPTEGTEVYNGDPDEHAEVRWATLAEVDHLIGQDKVFGPVWDHLATSLAE